MPDIRNAQAHLTGEPNPTDDLPLQLPPSDGQAEDDGTDTDFGEHEVTSEEDESVGLDVSVGFDHETDLAELLDGADREDQRWTEGTETAQDLISLDQRDLEEGAEDGWTEGNDAAGDQVAHHDDELSDEDLPALGPDPDGTGLDDGFLGVGQSDLGQDADEAELPPLDSSDPEKEGTDPDDLFDGGLLRPLELDAIQEPERIDLAPSVWATRIAREHVRLSDLGAVELGCSVMHVGSTPWLRSGRDLFIFDTGGTRRIAGMAAAAGRWVAVPGADACVVSHPQGLSQHDASGAVADLGGPSVDPSMFGHAIPAFTQAQREPKLWAQTRLGALFVRAEEPARWSLVDGPRPGRLLTSDGRRSIAYVHAPTERPCVLVQSSDAGVTWTQRRLAVADESLLQEVLVCRDAVLIRSQSMTTPILVHVGDANPRQPVEGLSGPLALVYEDGEVVLYGFVRVAANTLLVRQAFGHSERAPTVVHELPSNATVGAISARHDGTQTELLLVVGDRLLRLTIATEPE